MPVSLHSKLRLFPAASINQLRRVLEYLLADSAKTTGVLELELVGDRRIRTLNRKYRRKDQVTDVLSFPIQWQAPHRGTPWLLGGIVISVPVAARQARRAGRSIVDQVIRLALHGWVHLSGLDHERGPGEAQKFQKAEASLLKSLQRKGLIKWDGSLQF